MSAAPRQRAAPAPGAERIATLEAEVARLRELVLEQGQMLTGYERRLGVHERFRELAETVAAPLQPYEQAAAWQARRRSMHAIRAEGGRQ